MNPLPPHRANLATLTIAPTIWALHFLLTYVTAAVWCAKYTDEGGSLGPVRTVIVLYTMVALIGIIITGWWGFKRHNTGSADLPHDDDTPQDRQRFMGFATSLLASLSAVATLFVALAAFFFETCR